MESADGSDVISDAPTLTIDSCILSLTLPSNDSVMQATNLTVADMASKAELCADLLASQVRPTHDPHIHARQMLTFLLMGVGGITVACFGLVGNLLSAIVLTRKTMTTSTYCYLAALSICDLLVVACTLVLLIKDARYPEPESTGWPLNDQGSFYPYVFPYLHPAAITVQVTSVWLTLAFTVDRYIMICHPYKSEPFCTVSRARKIIASLVLASVAFNLPKFFEYHTVVYRPPLAAVRLSTVDDVAVVGCDLTEFGKSRAFKQLYHSWLYIVFVFGIPFVSLVVFNAFLVDAVRKARRRSAELRPSNRRTTVDQDSGRGHAYQLEEVPSVCSSTGRQSSSCRTSLLGAPPHNEMTYQLEERLSCPRLSQTTYPTSGRPYLLSALDSPRHSGTAGYQLEELATVVPRSASPVTRRIDTTVMLIGVVVIFIVCQLPALVSRTIWAFVDNPPRSFSQLPLYSLNETANFLVLLNSSVNILPYYFFGRRFRRQFLALFCPYCNPGRRGSMRDRCDSAVDSAILYNHQSAVQHRDSGGNQHCA